MKNKIDLKSTLIKICLVIVFFTSLLVIINIHEYNSYQETYNKKINAIFYKLEKEYPDITKEELYEIINSNTHLSSTLQTYGMTEASLVLPENKAVLKVTLTLNIFLLVFLIGFIIYYFLHYNHKKDLELAEIISYIEQINNKNYKLDIDNISEDELSILKNEIYKTTIMLKEQAENSNQDKINLKNSLSDISHQLKTPLTSILIMLDNLIDNPDIDEEIRQEFIKDIKREIVNINFLVQSLLKLSKFEANTVKFIKEKTTLDKIINASIEKLTSLSDLKNITFTRNLTSKKPINCDYMWQVEAITNILKNALEHSNNSSEILIETSENNVYSEIKITNYGQEISKKDLPHIFKRFYKGENSSADSIGIGLALAKTIIENDNGRIEVSSNSEKTTFTIKYFYYYSN